MTEFLYTQDQTVCGFIDSKANICKTDDLNKVNIEGLIGWEVGMFSDCWWKLARRLEKTDGKLILNSVEVRESCPGEHSGGPFYWYVPVELVYVPVYREGEGDEA